MACEEAGATGEPSVGPSEGPRERPFGALCTTEAHRLQQTSHGPTGSSPSRIYLLLPPRPSPPSHLLLLPLLRSTSSSSSCLSLCMFLFSLLLRFLSTCLSIRRTYFSRAYFYRRRFHAFASGEPREIHRTLRKCSRAI